MSGIERLAEAILSAAGSGLRHYTPQSRVRILEAAQKAIDAEHDAAIEKAAQLFGPEASYCGSTYIQNQIRNLRRKK